MKNPEATVDDKMSVGKFLEEMKDEPDVLVGFSNFLFEELLNSQATQNNLDSPPDALKESIEKMKTKWGPGSIFNMDAF